MSLLFKTIEYIFRMAIIELDLKNDDLKVQELFTASNDRKTPSDYAQIIIDQYGTDEEVIESAVISCGN